MFDIQMLFVAVGRGAKGCDLNNFSAKSNVRKPKSTPDQSAIREQCPHLVRTRIGGDIEILGMQAQQRIPNATTNKKGLVTGFVQPVEDF